MENENTHSVLAQHQSKCVSTSAQAFGKENDQQTSSANTKGISKQKSFEVYHNIPPRRLQKSLTDQSSIYSVDHESALHQNFRKSHTCGSLFAKCDCSTQSTPLSNTNNSSSRSSFVSFNDSEQFAETNRCDSLSCTRYQNSSDNTKKPKKLFQPYSHPDTTFVFTDENKCPTTNLGVKSESTSIITKGGKVEIKHPKRLSSPNIGNYTILDVAVHPEILIKISTKNDLGNNKKVQGTSKVPRVKSRQIIQRSGKKYTSTDSENSINVLDTADGSSSSRGDLQSSELYQIHSDELHSDYENQISSDNIKISENCDYTLYHQAQSELDELDPARKFFLESGILGPIGNNSACLIRKTSKIMQDPSFIEQVRKNSKLLRGSPGVDAYKESGNNEVDYIRGMTGNIMLDTKTDREDKIKALQEQVTHLRDVVVNRDSEICKLKREIHKLKSVLQQTTNHMHTADGDLLSSLQAKHGMAGQQSQVKSSCANMNLVKDTNNESKNMDVSRSYIDIGVRISATTVDYKSNHLTNAPIGLCQNSSIHMSGIPSYLQTPVVKKQGVSGESCDAASHQSNNVPIPKFDKDFKSKQLIKDAITDNDFLKNIDYSQVRELVESMYSIEVAKGEYVIREGEAGAHLYVSAEGEFEVVRQGVALGVMGPGKAFGELAILYNCTRTASIRVLSHARVWVLDRRVFQQIMMRTGMQRIEDNVNFLKSVPLLKNLSNDVLAKIADVLEVEFYPAGAYIIRQGTSGDTFFLIRQGRVKVTQKIESSLEEKEIRTLERGDYFGEQALINEDKRTANIIALPPGVECLTLDRESFTHLIGNLCELKEKNYGDESRARTADVFKNKFENAYGADVKQELPYLELKSLEIVAALGIGGFGRVELVKYYRKNKVETFALKCLKKKHIIDTKQEEHVFSERTIMLSCNTPFICRLYRTFRDSKYVYMLLEACMGGEVWTILRDRGCFNENITQFIIGCVLEAFEYLHTRGIIYRDLKPENLMLNERGYVKLVDFGFAKYLGHSNKTWTFCGTPEYVAPEIILNKGHDRAVDYWALGILIHELLTGKPPFTANDPMKTYNIILKGIDMIDFPKHISKAAITLIKKLCRDIPAERLGYQKGGIQDIKKHKWFQGFDWDGLANLSLIPPFLRPISHALDTSYFDNFGVETELPPDETSGWDVDF